MFDIKSALSLLPEDNDTRTVQQWGVEAVLYKSNQALLLSMPQDSAAFHLGDQRFVNIEMLEGAIKVSCKETNYYATAGAEVDALFSLPSAYKITALTRCKLLLLAREPRAVGSFTNEEEYRKWYKNFNRALDIPEERLANF